MSAGKSGRRSQRVRVHLSVSYGRADEFVREYAENLCAGGMFIAGPGPFEALEEVQVEVNLPGYDEFRVVAQVVHVITPEMAEKFGHRAGAGVQIRKAPDEFHDALHGYLMRLGRRADCRVLVADPAVGEELAKTGYKVGTAPDPDGLVEAVVHASEQLLGVVVRPADAKAYSAAAVAAGDPELVLVCAGPDDVGEVLAELDDRL